MDYDFDKLKALLDDNHKFPTDYTFKLICPIAKEEDVMRVILDHPVVKKPSKKGNYTSINFSVMVNSSDDVINYYKQFSKIEGIIVL